MDSSSGSFGSSVRTAQKRIQLFPRISIHSCLNQLFQSFFIFDLPAICNFCDFRGSKPNSRC